MGLISHCLAPFTHLRAQMTDCGREAAFLNPIGGCLTWPWPCSLTHTHSCGHHTTTTSSYTCKHTDTRTHTHIMGLACVWKRIWSDCSEWQPQTIQPTKKAYWLKAQHTRVTLHFSTLHSLGGFEDNSRWMETMYPEWTLTCTANITNIECGWQQHMLMLAWIRFTKLLQPYSGAACLPHTHQSKTT